MADTPPIEDFANPRIRLYVGDHALLARGDAITLNKDQSHYLVNVMRQKEGAVLLLFNGRDGEWQAKLTQAHKRAAILTLEDRRRDQTSLPDIWLLFAPVKKSRTDFIVEKATELGVAQLQPVLTTRTITSRVNQERLQATAIEAVEQCGGLTIPQVHGPEKLSDLLAGWPEDRALYFCDEALDAPPLKDVASAKPAALLIGPEGGFSEDERQQIKALPQAKAVTLGPRILRAETAALAALTIWQSAAGDW